MQVGLVTTDPSAGVDASGDGFHQDFSCQIFLLEAVE